MPWGLAHQELPFESLLSLKTSAECPLKSGREVPAGSASNDTVNILGLVPGRHGLAES